MILPSPSRCLKYNLREWELHFWFGPLVLSSSDYLLLATSNFSSSTTNPKLHLRSPPIFSGVHFLHSVVFCVMFRRTFVLNIVCPFGLFFMSFYCLPLRLLIIPLVFTNFFISAFTPPLVLAGLLFVLIYLKFSA
jgi:hypothetical protein